MPRLRFAIPALLFLGASSLAAEEGECRSDARAELLGRIGAVQDYSLKATVETPGGGSIAHISGKEPNFLKVEMAVDGQFGSRFLMVFDGEHQWLEMRAGDEVEVHKLRLRSVAQQNRPFDTSYYLNGSGLLSGEDFPRTITMLLLLYDLTLRCANGGLRLVGPVSEERLLAYAVAKNSTRTEESAARFIARFGWLELEVDPVAVLPSGYVLRSAQDADSEMTVNFMDMELNTGLSADLFSYSPPPGVAAVDVTDAILHQHAH